MLAGTEFAEMEVGAGKKADENEEGNVDWILRPIKKAFQ